MRLYKQLKLILAYLILISHVHIGHAETQVSGYASFVAGKVTSGNEFLADYPKTGVYDKDWSFSPDTSIGVQLNTDINDKLEFVIQAVSNGATDFDVELDWAYISYQLSTDLSFQAGRKRLPLYYYSDFFDVGYAYYWIRPPADNYTWQISNYNGLSLMYQPQIGDWDSLFYFYFGREDSEENELLSMLISASVDETWKNMFGVVAELSQEWVELRFTYMNSQLDRTVNDIITTEDVNQTFSGVSINLYVENISVLSEFNQYERSASDIHVKTSMLSVAYRVGDFTPHLTRSMLDQDDNIAGGDEHHETKSLGFRWDLNKKTALKIQYDKVKDEGVNIPVLGSAESISIGIDFVF